MDDVASGQNQTEGTELFARNGTHQFDADGSKAPVLGDLPTLGRLFGSAPESEAKRKGESKPEVATAPQVAGSRFEESKIAELDNLFTAGFPLATAGDGFRTSPTAPEELKLKALAEQSDKAATEAQKLIADGKLYYQMGKLDEAQAKLEQAKKLEPQNQAAYDSLNLVSEARFKDALKKGGIASRQALAECGKGVGIARGAELDRAQKQKGESMKKSSPYLEAKRKLEELQRFQRVLSMQVASESTDLSLPKSTMVDVVERATIEPAKSPGPWERLRGTLGGEVERFRTRKS